MTKEEANEICLLVKDKVAEFEWSEDRTKRFMERIREKLREKVKDGE